MKFLIASWCCSALAILVRCFCTKFIMIPYHVRELLASPWTSVVRRNLVANLTYLTYVNNTLPLALAVHEISRHFWATMVQRASEFWEKKQQVVCKYHTKALSTNKFVYFVKAADIFYSIISVFYSVSRHSNDLSINIVLYTSFKSGVLDWQ